MPGWSYTLNLRDVYHVEGLSFIERRDAIVQRIRTSRFFGSDYELDEIVDDLAQTEDIADFDEVFDMFYDWADDHRVWVATL